MLLALSVGFVLERLLALVPTLKKRWSRGIVCLRDSSSAAQTIGWVLRTYERRTSLLLRRTCCRRVLYARLVGTSLRVFLASEASHRYGPTSPPPPSLQDLIFGDSAGCDWRNPKRSQRDRSLTSALSSIIWRAGDGKTGEGKPLQKQRINSQKFRKPK